ncbi:hypothetical protein KOI35_46810 [Actinoplanes bogorensis]|uniref:Ribosomally synthesized peptide with SipW-like signal peptide n=1 Tax=Paractinoplanes bogorensis TaxID=1610840 RepID=A0ABS5Z5Q9_9ACTN|nr:hypothetical protein [Actinoplanes bogorensis]MBU2671034.1 hypothetical protein [Actinoplanes bogorensis]
MRKMTKRSAVVAGVAVAAIGVGATAWAAGWFQGSSTTYAASSTIGEMTAFVDLRTQATTTNPMRFYPGKTLTLTKVTVTNPNDYAVRIASVSAITVTNAGECTQSKAGFALTDLTTAAFPSGSTPEVTLGNLTMSPNASEDCAGQGGLIIKATLTGAVAG